LDCSPHREEWHRMTQKKRLTTRQKKGIEALLEAPTVTKASQTSGISRRQLYRWLDLPQFRAELNRRQGEAVGAVTRRLTFLASEAVEALIDVNRHPSQKGATNKRLSSVSILEHALKYRDANEIDERLTALERKVFNGK